jgi:hypothetical protein
MRESDILKLFFNFYTLNVIRDFKDRENHIYYHSKSSLIDDYAEMATEKMYREVRDALRYSCLREFRHAKDEYGGYKICDAGYNTCKKIRKYLHTAGCPEGSTHYGKIGEDFEKILTDSGFSFSYVRDIFLDGGYWNSGYGGHLWGRATQFLYEIPKNEKQKVLWVDRVLDLYHNNGPLLDKTNFGVLFESHDDLDDQCPLDFRASASLTKLSEHCSRKVRNIFIANRRALPHALQY